MNFIILFVSLFLFFFFFLLNDKNQLNGTSKIEIKKD